jgi:hypothetical protein
LVKVQVVRLEKKKKKEKNQRTTSHQMFLKTRKKSNKKHKEATKKEKEKETTECTYVAKQVRAASWWLADGGVRHGVDIQNVKASADQISRSNVTLCCVRN